MIELTCQANADIGENTVAIAFEDCAPTGLRAGSPVMVIGNKKTVAQIVINDAAQSGHVLMGATMRLNANVNEGETIRLRPLPAQAMQRSFPALGCRP